MASPARPARQGPAGRDQARLGPPGADGAFVWRGAWSASATYVPGDTVAYEGSSWRAFKVSTNVPPVEGVTTVLRGSSLPVTAGTGASTWRANASRFTAPGTPTTVQVVRVWFGVGTPPVVAGLVRVGLWDDTNPNPSALTATTDYLFDTDGGRAYVDEALNLAFIAANGYQDFELPHPVVIPASLAFCVVAIGLTSGDQVMVRRGSGGWNRRGVLATTASPTGIGTTANTDASFTTSGGGYESALELFWLDTYWERVAAKGDPGPTGATGATGPAGGPAGPTGPAGPDRPGRYDGGVRVAARDQLGLRDDRHQLGRQRAGDDRLRPGLRLPAGGAGQPHGRGGRLLRGRHPDPHRGDHRAARGAAEHGAVHHLVRDRDRGHSGGEVPPGGGGGGWERTTEDHVTASLGAQAYELATVTLPDCAAYRIYKVTADKPCRVRLYTTAASGTPTSTGCRPRSRCRTPG